MAKLDQGWYERAADIINGSYSTPQERIEIFNDLWCAYLFVLLQLKQTREANLLTIGQAFENTIAMIAETESKEMNENGTNETHEAAANSEQLG